MHKLADGMGMSLVRYPQVREANACGLVDVALKTNYTRAHDARLHVASYHQPPRSH